jgi:hypothetical protein
LPADGRKIRQLPVATRTQAPPPLSPDTQPAFIARSGSLAPRFKTELLPPPGND